jgi:DNA uptake protein ComE-like DNA-binding protein
MKEFLQQYLRFSKKERIGLTMLLIGMAFFFWLPEWYKTKPVRVQPDTAMIRMMEASVSADRWSGTRNTFNPKEPYGQPYRPPYAQRYTQPYQRPQQYGRSYYDHQPYQRRPIRVVEINAAGMAEWEALPGIGPVLAARIMKYRDKLGGFTRIEQVKQTYGISDSLYLVLQPFLQISEAIVQGNSQPYRKAEPAASAGGTLPANSLPNANTATREALEAAGIPEQIARSIVVYRSRYGLFKKLEDLRQIVLINDSLYSALSGKLRVE